MGRIFGTDGARGVAGVELTAELAVNIGRSAAMVLAAEKGGRPLVVIGKDTRVSSDMLESAVTAGLCSVGADVLLLDVVPTPAVAYLIKEYGADAGVMLSASHNPYEFNGIKLFGPEGYKLTDEEEERIEAILLDHAVPYDIKNGAQIGRVRRTGQAAGDYIRHLARLYEGGFPEEKRILIDCSNGSASVTAPGLFAQLGVEADFIHANPDGLNINQGCGSTHIEKLAARVVKDGYDMGFAFDGDADRFLACDEKGNILDGDQLIAVFADYLSREGKLHNQTVVVTSMSNLGLFNRMREQGYHAETTKVGDRYVLEKMRQGGHSLGGEQSGHMIFLDLAATGDGQLSAVMLLNAVGKSKGSLSELGALMRRFPQVMKNVAVPQARKQELMELSGLKEVIGRWENGLGERGRILVRASGTEPLIRVMVEGEREEEISDAAAAIAAVIEEEL